MKIECVVKEVKKVTFDDVPVGTVFSSYSGGVYLKLHYNNGARCAVRLCEDRIACFKGDERITVLKAKLVLEGV